MHRGLSQLEAQTVSPQALSVPGSAIGSGIAHVTC